MGMEKRVIPAFATEAEEADWWYEHREEIAQDLITAVRAGKNGIGTRGRLKQIRERKAQAATGSVNEQFATSIK